MELWDLPTSDVQPWDWLGVLRALLRKKRLEPEENKVCRDSSDSLKEDSHASQPAFANRH